MSILAILDSQPIALHMLVYGTSLRFSLNESTFFIYFFKLTFYLRTNIFRWSLQGCVDSLESWLQCREKVIPWNYKKGTERGNTDHILDSTHKLAILITPNKALLYLHCIMQLKLGQILAPPLGDCWVDMMPWCHGWVCRPPSIASHIQIGYV